MGPENTQKPEESTNTVSPPPYMPPIEAAQIVPPQQQPNDAPVAPADPSATPVATKLTLSSDVPVWVWIALAAVVVLGIIGWIGFSWYQSNRAIYPDSPLVNPQNQTIQNTTTDTNNTDNSTIPTAVNSTIAGTTTVTIGSQVWMKYNMNVGSFGASEDSLNRDVEKSCYGNDISLCDAFGALYDWNEAMKHSVTEGAQGICPAGFHVPTDVEFTTLLNGLGGVNMANSKLIDGGSSGFDGRFGGYFSGGSNNQFYTDIGNSTYFWTSTQYLNSDGTSDSARIVGLYPDSPGVKMSAKRDAFLKTYKLSVRCIKNQST